MKLIIDIDNDYFEIIKYRVEHGDDYKPYTLIANGIPYEEKPQKEDCGKWIFHEDFYESICYGCNQCGNLANIPSNFCPNCGKRMKKYSPFEEKGAQHE